MAGILNMSTPALALAGLYMGIVLLLLGLHLRSGWPWPVKSAAIGLALPTGVGAFLALEAQLGWPSQNALPAEFQLHAAVIDEPGANTDNAGAIYLWLTPWGEIASIEESGTDVAIPPDRRPRAFDLPYSRELHQKVETMQERLERGEFVTGRHVRNQSWKRRFGLQDGQIDLEAPPPPPMPAKDD
ncbi:MAG: hypothetical protein ACR2RF_14975 [Geminicoccaceae bacterium]